MYCYNCGKEVGEVNFCPYCGVELNRTSQVYTPENVGEYQPINHSSTNAAADDAPSFGMALLSFFIPIVGLVLYIIWYKEYPRKAKSCLKGLITSVVLGIITFCCVFASLGSIYEEAFDYDNYYYEDYYGDFENEIEDAFDF